MLYNIKELAENDYKKECARLLVAFENPNYKQENTIHIAYNVTVGYGLDLLKCDGQPKDFLLDYLPNDSKKLKIGNEELTFYEIIEKYRSNQKGFTDPNIVKDYLQNKAFNFSLTQEQAQKVLENMISKYEKRLSSITTYYLPYSRERASLLTMRYLGKPIENNGLVKAIKNNSRFLSWFIIRYKTNINTYLGYIARSCDEADIYLSSPNINQMKLIFDIFSYLNIKKEQIKYRTYKDKESIKNFTTHNKKDILLNLAKWYENDLDFIGFGTTNQVNKISKSNISNTISNLTKKAINDIVSILFPYLTHLNTLTQKTFTLENIYCIKSFFGVLGAMKLDNVSAINKALHERFSVINNVNVKQQDNLIEDNSTITPILIIYPYPTPLPIQIIQPQNTFITLLVAKKAKIDCSRFILNQCEILYLDYDENETQEVNINPKAIELKTHSETILSLQDSNNYEAKIDNILYFINKDEKILKIALNDKIDEAIELYNFAKENEYTVSKGKASKIFDIQLKLDKNEIITSQNNGNFTLSVTNLVILDKDGGNFNDEKSSNLKAYLHNCENRIVYESISISKNEDNTYRANFKFDLIQDEYSNFFQRTTKILIATQNLSNDFSTSEIHAKGNVAIISLSSADKKCGSYTFNGRISMREFDDVQPQPIYIENDNNKYDTQVKESKNGLHIIDIVAYMDKEQQNKTTTINENETIFVIAKLSDDKIFYDESIKWAYCLKNSNESLDTINAKNQHKKLIAEGNDIAFSLNMLKNDDKQTLLNSKPNMFKYELILFAYFNVPAIRVGDNKTSLVLNIKQ